MKHITQLLISVACAAAIGVTPLQASAQSVFPPYGANVSLNDALKLIDAAKAEARKNKWNLSIAVVDTSGTIVAMHRMDEGLLASAQIAVDKARTANGYKRPTKALQDAVTSGFTPILGLPSATPVDGGIPVVVNGKIIGAIGVSGASPNEDGVVAAAGLAAMK